MDQVVFHTIQKTTLWHKRVGNRYLCIVVTDSFPFNSPILQFWMGRYDCATAFVDDGHCQSDDVDATGRNAKGEDDLCVLIMLNRY